MRLSHYSVLWLGMMALTLVSYAFAGSGGNGRYFVAFVLVAAFIKGQVIIDFFMKLKSAGLLWRLLATTWLSLVLIVISSVYWLYG